MAFTLDHLLKNNRQWAEERCTVDPEFFRALQDQQAPEYLWIGCADSRVPANEIVGLMPGELFVHRNVGNVVSTSDLNCLSVLQYAVDVLQVKHVIITGHYGCGGVRAALNHSRVGLADHWVGHIRAVANLHQKELNALETEEQQFNRLCELNVLEQAQHVIDSPIVEDAWSRGQELTVHSWIYSLKDGLIHTLRQPVSGSA